MAFLVEPRGRRVLAIILLVSGLAAIAALPLSVDFFFLLLALGSEARLTWVLLATGTMVALQLYALSQVVGWVASGLPSSADEPPPPLKRAAAIAGAIVWLLVGVFQLWVIVFTREKSVTSIFGIAFSRGLVCAFSLGLTWALFTGLRKARKSAGGGG